MEEALDATGLWKIKEYIWRWQAAITEYIVNHPRYELWMGADQIIESIRLMQWWD